MDNSLLNHGSIMVHTKSMIASEPLQQTTPVASDKRVGDIKLVARIFPTSAVALRTMTRDQGTYTPPY